MNKILILQGLPASGKSTYARELMEKEKGWIRINKDLLREMLHCGKWSRKNEKEIIDTRDELISSFLFEKRNIIVDDTNFSEKHINKITNIVNELNENGYNIEIEVKFIDTPLYECIERDSKRPNPVGKKVILGMWRKYLWKPPKPFVRDYNLLDAIIVDIDGTLAYKGDRDIFDYDKVNLDSLNNNLSILLHCIARDVQVIIVSGRDDECRGETMKWLDEHIVPYSELYMRKTGDKRPDTVIKKEIYENEIKNNYNIVAVIDDRPSVIRMWKEQGLFVLDANVNDPRVDF